MGVIGLLFGFLGQDNIMVSSWRCEECRNRFQDPNEMKRSIEKNEKAFNIYFRYRFIILAIYAVSIAVAISLCGLLFSTVLKNPFFILGFVLMILLLIIAIFIPHLIIKYFVSYIISSKKEEIIIMQNKIKSKAQTGEHNVTKTPTKIRYVRVEKKQPNNMDVERDTNGLWHLPDDQW